MSCDDLTMSTGLLLVPGKIRFKLHVKSREGGFTRDSNQNKPSGFGDEN